MNYLKQYTINLEHDKQIRNIGRKEEITGTTLAKLERLGFEGSDASLEISLFDYGMAWVEKDGEYHFIFAVDIVQGRFDNGTFPVGTDWKKEFGWMNPADIARFLDTNGVSEEEFSSYPFTQQVYDLTNYWGWENIFGGCYYEGFYIFKDGRNRVIEWLEWVNGVHAF